MVEGMVGTLEPSDGRQRVAATRLKMSGRVRSWHPPALEKPLPHSCPEQGRSRSTIANRRAQSRTPEREQNQRLGPAGRVIAMNYRAVAQRVRVPSTPPTNGIYRKGLVFSVDPVSP